MLKRSLFQTLTFMAIDLQNDSLSQQGNFLWTVTVEDEEDNLK